MQLSIEELIGLFRNREELIREANSAILRAEDDAKRKVDAAIAHVDARILEIDGHCRALTSELDNAKAEVERLSKLMKRVDMKKARGVTHV